MPSRETTTAQTYRIRPATMTDCSAIRRIRNAAVRESLAIWTSIEQNSVEAKTWLAPMVQRGTALVAHVSGRPQDVVGFAVAGPWRSYEGYAPHSRGLDLPQPVGSRERAGSQASRRPHRGLTAGRGSYHDRPDRGG